MIESDEDVFDIELAESPEDRAVRLLMRRGRTHMMNHGRYLAVHFHTATEAEARLMQQVFGARYYKHGSSWNWQTANPQIVARVKALVMTLEPVGANLRFKHFFEKPQAADEPSAPIAESGD